VGHINGSDDAPVQFWAHSSMQHVQGYLRSHWTPPLGKNLPYISPADAMVINFEVKNQVGALWNCCSKANVQKAQNGPSLLSSLMQ
jgi:hypothetical protein